MKKILTFFFVMILSIVKGQDSTKYLISNRPPKLKLYLGVGSEFALLNQKGLFSIGGDLGVIVNKKVFLEAFTRSSINSTNRIVLEETAPLNEYYLFQIGLKTGYIIKPHKALHIVPSVKTAYYTLFYNDLDDLSVILGTSLLITPSLSFQFNLSKNIRAEVGSGYRLATDNDIFFKMNKATGLEHQLSFMFGRFSR